MPITGQCLCGAVRYQANADAIMTRACYCRVCQYLACGSASINVCFPSDAVSIEGMLSDYRSIADSGNVMHRRFCPHCGTQMFSAAESRPHLIFVRAGTLDDREAVKPQMSIWTASAPSWACINTTLPSVPGQPPPPTMK